VEKILTSGERRSRHGGFSLILVLLIAVCGTIMVGTVVYMTSGSSGAARVTVSKEDLYIRMQGEVESAKAALISEMTSADQRLKMRDIGLIISSEDLIVHENGGSGGVFPPANVDKPITAWGKTGNLSVRILDMRYPANKVNSGDAALIASLPPCMDDLRLNGSGGGGGDGDDSPLLPGGGSGGGSGTAGPADPESIGVYLIRVTATVGGRSSAIETSVMQRTGGGS
jgi:hypothetical protein